MLVSMKMQTGVGKLVLQSDKIHLNNRPGLAMAQPWWNQPEGKENYKQAPSSFALLVTQVSGSSLIPWFTPLPFTSRWHGSSAMFTGDGAIWESDAALWAAGKERRRKGRSSADAWLSSLCCPGWGWYLCAPWGEDVWFLAHGRHVSLPGTHLKKLTKPTWLSCLACNELGQQYTSLHIRLMAKKKRSNFCMLT